MGTNFHFNCCGCNWFGQTSEMLRHLNDDQTLLHHNTFFNMLQGSSDSDKSLLPLANWFWLSFLNIFWRSYLPTFYIKYNLSQATAIFLTHYIRDGNGFSSLFFIYSKSARAKTIPQIKQTRQGSTKLAPTWVEYG